jgi:hypothetical protein
MLQFIKYNTTLIFCFGILTTIVGYGCKPSDSSTPEVRNEGYSHASDTILKKEIEFEVDEINSKLKMEDLKKIPYPAPGASDTLEYWNVNEKPARISLKLYPPDMMIWHTFFLKDGHLILVRSRAWFKSLPMPWAEENMIYLRDDKIIYCDERRMDLPGDDIPASLRDKPFAMSTSSFADLEKKYQSDWIKIKELLSVE